MSGKTYQPKTAKKTKEKINLKRDNKKQLIIAQKIQIIGFNLLSLTERQNQSLYEVLQVLSFFLLILLTPDKSH